MTASLSATTPSTQPFPDMAATYADLPSALHRPAQPYGASQPRLIRLNEALAEALGFNVDQLNEDEQAAFFSGNQLAPTSTPLALAYSGHQFGHFNPQLGDGRALLLGEVTAKDGLRYDIQLKGSGQTPFSRQGDGRAALGPVLREYIVSEAMHALGVPTTRALAAVSTGDPVLRETILPGAMVTRVAASHLRVGTFQYAAARQDKDTLAALVSFALARHDPIREGDEPDALKLLKGTMERQASLVAQWMGIGFIHGVMNTDNCTISGETIDYGPCAFMDAYERYQVYSSIDHQGRYAFANQPPIAHWNMAVLAQALLPLIDPDEDQAVEIAQEAVNGFPALYEKAYLAVMRDKLGLIQQQEEDGELVQSLLSRMEEHSADFTNTFRALSDEDDGQGYLESNLGSDGQPWWNRWQKRLADDGSNATNRRANQKQVNPAIIPRNHAVEAMIKAALEGDFEPFHALVDALEKLFDEPGADALSQSLSRPPKANEVVAATFCGT